MNIEIIFQMINNSTWTSSNNKYVYNFINGRDLSINGQNHQEYSLNISDDKIILQLGSSYTYYVEYINDFNLHLYNAQERFKIMPY